MTPHDPPDSDQPPIDQWQIQQLQQLLAQEDASQAVEAERRRLAELLNGSVINPLNLLLSQAGAYEQTMGANPQVGMVVSVLASLARQVLQQTLDLQANLHPTLLEVLGLEAALETLAQQTSRTHGTRIHLKLDRLRERLPATIELALFRAVQDAFDQMIKTARATQIDIQMITREEELTFSLRDNGMIASATNPRALLADTERRLIQTGGQLTRSDNTLQIVFRLSPPIDLTARELEVIALLAEGLTNKEIASRLDLSTRTVNFHLDNIYSKLGVNSRTEAAIYALQSGLVRQSMRQQPRLG
ncbi:MAG TPA: LuxR C-terminal-related transcriptional regulator [Phototrophicaceae bacterium]|jgi:DNA-binding CsgD family transcriptional regulator|nr:LuxR C-terminal-related transcriptional regulator [Phototrophicaceae bacterium]